MKNLKMAVELSVGRIVLDNFREIEILDEILREKKKLSMYKLELHQELMAIHMILSKQVRLIQNLDSQ